MTTTPAGYRDVHFQLAEQRGRAADHLCVDCGGSAEQWSFCRDDSDGLTSFAYSTDLDRYAPRCKPCHRRFDRPVQDLRTRPERKPKEPAWVGRDRWITRQQAADLLGETLRNLDKMIASGDLTAYRITGLRAVRLNSADVEALLPAPTTTSEWPA